MVKNHSEMVLTETKSGATFVKQSTILHCRMHGGHLNGQNMLVCQ